jgi:hypothetical protein
LLEESLEIREFLLSPFDTLLTFALGIPEIEFEIVDCLLDASNLSRGDG